MSNVDPHKRPLQKHCEEQQQYQGSLKPIVETGVNQNAITSYLQGQLEASQNKRRRLDFSSNRPVLDSVHRSILLSKLKSMSRGQSEGTIGSSAAPEHLNDLASTPRKPIAQPQGISRTRQDETRIHPPVPSPIVAPQEESEPGRRTKENDAKFYLHRVCSHFACNEDVVGIALTLDPQAVRRPKPGPIVNNRKRANGFAYASSKKLTWRPPKRAQYSYPINVAIQHGASLQVLELLVNQGPDVLLKKDGHDQSASLSIALCHKPRDLDLVDLIMFGNIQTLAVADRRNNYPLHVACAKGATLGVLRRLYSHYPAALFCKNFHNETPLDIAQRCTTLLDEASLNFLQARFHGGCLLRISRKKECRRADAKSLL